MNEISPNGEVVQLQNVELPFGEGKITKNEPTEQMQEPQPKEGGEKYSMSDIQDESSKQGEDFSGPNALESEFQPSVDDVELLNSTFGKATTEALFNLHNKILKNPGRRTRDFPIVTSAPITDRTLRTEAHQALRRIFHSRLDSRTNNDNGSIKIAAAPKSNPRSNARSVPSQTADGRFVQNQGKGKMAWDHLGGEYLHFTLAKENKDTMEAVGFIASQLKLHPKNFQFAGTKDRRGVTTQRVSGYRVHRDALAGLNKKMLSVRVGDFGYKANGLDLGDLGGNQFTITLRDCLVPGEEGQDSASRARKLEQVVAQRVEAFEKIGWINYYGLQRFGTFAHGTEAIGVKMLQGDFEGAIALILSYNPDNLEHENSADNGFISRDDLKRAEALHIWAKQRNSRVALQKLPRRFNAESAIIKHLGVRDKKTGDMRRAKDFQGALGQIPRNLRMMYVHAYQSLVWNMVAGERIKLFGTEVVAGDLVLIGDKEKDQHIGKLNGRAEEEDEIDDEGEVIIKPKAEDSSGDAAGNFTRARPLSEEEAKSGKYDIFDVVLPLPGFDVEYPANAIGAFYEEFMGSERGGGLDPHDMRRKWKEISLSGGYRKLMARPLAKVGWEVRRYSQSDEQLVKTGLEGMMDRPDKMEDKASGDVEEMNDAHEEVQQEDDKMAEDEKVAVILKLQLGSSQYATMALRELTKGGSIGFRPEYGTSR